ncbi:hypothetical protein [Antarctobacter jejuensis]|uniref:hypothetical protein n=1 Tax=Antarctobacter jejuensis TaxID=1439938 RepID=UPI003FD1E24E
MSLRTRSYTAFALLAFAVGLTACTQFPELDAAQTPGVETAPFPKLLPLDDLLGGPMPEVSAETITYVEGRVGALQARADRLRRAQVAQGPVDSRIARLRQKAADLRTQ